MAKILILVAAFILTANSLFGQITGPSSVTFLTFDPDGNLVATHEDSVWVKHGLLTGLTGTVSAGIAGFVDSTGAIDTAAYDEPQLNRCALGFGTGKPGQLRTSGMIDVAWATKIGKIYWLENSGVCLTTRPTASNVWRVEMGRCIGTGKFHVHPKTPTWSD